MRSLPALTVGASCARHVELRQGPRGRRCAAIFKSGAATPAPVRTCSREPLSWDRGSLAWRVRRLRGTRCARAGTLHRNLRELGFSVRARVSARVCCTPCNAWLVRPRAGSWLGLRGPALRVDEADPVLALLAGSDLWPRAPVIIVEHGGVICRRGFRHSVMTDRRSMVTPGSFYAAARDWPRCRSAGRLPSTLGRSSHHQCHADIVRRWAQHSSSEPVSVYAIEPQSLAPADQIPAFASAT